MPALSPQPRPLPRKFYERHADEVARDLLGKLLIRQTAEGLASGRILETEAYLAADDPACHASRGKTRKNASMFGPPGHAYVYPIHSRYCFNVVTEPETVASAVLVRAVEPLEGLTRMQARRGRDHPRELASGPARLCEAFAIDRRLDGGDLTLGCQLWIVDGGGRAVLDAAVGRSPGIGGPSAEDLPLRFFIRGHALVSGPRRLRG